MTLVREIGGAPARRPRAPRDRLFAGDLERGITATDAAASGAASAALRQLRRVGRCDRHGGRIRRGARRGPCSDGGMVTRCLSDEVQPWPWPMSSGCCRTSRWTSARSSCASRMRTPARPEAQAQLRQSRHRPRQPDHPRYADPDVDRVSRRTRARRALERTRPYPSGRLPAARCLPTASPSPLAAPASLFSPACPRTAQRGSSASNPRPADGPRPPVRHRWSPLPAAQYRSAGCLAASRRALPGVRRPQLRRHARHSGPQRARSPPSRPSWRSPPPARPGRQRGSRPGWRSRLGTPPSTGLRAPRAVRRDDAARLRGTSRRAAPRSSWARRRRPGCPRGRLAGDRPSSASPR